MKQFEYTIFKIESDRITVEILNEQGAQGWELVAMKLHSEYVEETAEWNESILTIWKREKQKGQS